MSNRSKPYGTIIFASTRMRTTWTRGSNCKVSGVDQPHTLVGDGGFGYRDRPIKSDMIRPTNYQVWWSESLAGSAFATDGQLRECPKGRRPDGGWIWGFYRTRSHNVMPRMFMPSAIFYDLGGARMFNGTTSLPQISANMNLKVSNNLSAQVLNEVQRLENLVLLDVAKQTNQLGILLAESLKTSRYFIGKLESVMNFLLNLSTSKKKFFRWLKRNYKSISRHKSVKDYRKFRLRAQNHMRRQPWDSRIGSRWLEYSYAIMPVIHDVNGVLEFANQATWRPALFSVKKRGKVERDYVFSPHSFYKVQTKHTIKVLVDHSFQIDDPLAFALNRMGVNPSQFIFGTAYELIPFSFVADWVLGFQDLLQGMAALQGVRWNHGYASITVEGIEHGYEHTSNFGDAYPPKDFGDFLSEKIPNAPFQAPAGVEREGMPIGICYPVRHKFKGFKRVLRSRPSYSYSVQLNFLTKRRALSLLSLLAVLRPLSKT